MIDFRNFLKPVMDFLNSSGLEVKYEGKNNLTIDGKKISGNSGHIFKNRVLHHGTLLFNTNLDILEKSINGNHSLYFGKDKRAITYYRCRWCFFANRCP